MGCGIARAGFHGVVAEGRALPDGRITSLGTTRTLRPAQQAA